MNVFSPDPLGGNPLAVVRNATGLSDEQMAAIARWTNLSETAFLLPPSSEAADYRVRIFTPLRELPFAGHPTLGACWAWLAGGGKPRRRERIVQQCGVGLVNVRRKGRLEFAAPPLLRTGALEPAILAKIVRALSLSQDDILAFEVRAFIGGGGYEDPVTGSLNASLAQWLIAAGLARSPYIASQGTALQRAGRVHLRKDGESVWVGGDVIGVVRGEITL